MVRNVHEGCLVVRVGAEHCDLLYTVGACVRACVSVCVASSHSLAAAVAELTSQTLTTLTVSFLIRDLQSLSTLPPHVSLFPPFQRDITASIGDFFNCKSKLKQRLNCWREDQRRRDTAAPFTASRAMLTYGTR